MKSHNTISQKINGYVRTLQMIPPFDKRHSEPSKNYGIHGMEIRFELIKNNRAVQFVVYSNIFLPHLYDEWDNNKENRIKSHLRLFFKPLGADVGYHSPTSMYESQNSDDCHLLKGGKCYYDGSGLKAEKWVDIWLKEGNDKIWEMLEEEWKEVFKKRKKRENN